MINNNELLELENYIINLEHPTIFLFNLLKYNIDDQTTSYIIRIFLKHHSNYACENNIASVFIYENEYPLTIKIFTDFYNLIKQKIILLMVIQKWLIYYDNNTFWDLELNNQITFLKEKKHYFNSIFDCANGGFPFYNKIMGLLNNEYREEILYNIEERLLLILNIFNKKIFNHLEIPLILVSDFYNLSSTQIIKYLNIIYVRLNKVLDNMIYILEEYSFIYIRLQLLYNPIINEIKNDSDIDSDIASDIELFC
jgi:hypothetical protein